MRIHTRELSRAEFAAMEGPWADCLARSSADALFMSWPWLYTWWEIWSETMDLDLILIGVFDDQEKLIGVGPFFRHRYRTPIGLKVDRLHTLGNAWRIGPTVRTEYTGLIVDQEHKHEVTTEIFRYLASLEWDELIVSDIVPDEAEIWLQNLNTSPGGVSVLTRSEDRGVIVDTRHEMKGWLRRLGSNTRLKLYNRRRYLTDRGDLQVSCVDDESEVKQFFERLNRFHLARWGKPCFDPLAVRFHLRLSERLNTDQEPCYSVMHFNGRPISVLYDIKAGSRIYNLQSGYQQNFDPKVSLGTLHFGFAIEEAFERPACKGYDLLAGFGKTTFYKRHLKGDITVFKTLQFVRNPLLRFIYEQQAKLPHAFRQPLNRLFRL